MKQSLWLLITDYHWTTKFNFISVSLMKTGNLYIYEGSELENGYKNASLALVYLIFKLFRIIIYTN